MSALSAVSVFLHKLGVKSVKNYRLDIFYFSTWNCLKNLKYFKGQIDSCQTVYRFDFFSHSINFEKLFKKGKFQCPLTDWFLDFGGWFVQSSIMHDNKASVGLMFYGRYIHVVVCMLIANRGHGYWRKWTESFKILT